MHKLFCGKPGESATQEARNLGLVNFQDTRCPRLSHAPRANGRSDPHREIGFGKPLFRIENHRR
jgi:hypothetical protein